MKILLLNQTFYPDALATSQQVTDLALYLVNAGHRVTVVTGKLGYEDKSKRYGRHEWHRGVEIFRVGSLGFGKSSILERVLESISFDALLAWRLLFLPAHDIVISFTSPPLIGLFGMLFTLLKGGRSVQWLMDVNPDAAIAVGYLSRKSLVTRVLNWIFEVTLKYADRIIVLDRWMQRGIEAHGVSPNKIEIVPPWSVVNLQEAASSDSAGVQEFRRKNGLDGKFIVLYSGNHSVVHPLDTVLESAKRMRDDKDVAFVFMGNGLRTIDVAEFKKRHGLENIYQLPPQPREVFHDALSAANVHLVVMGEAVSGLVHTSKIYGILASGRPYVVVGPEKSHLADLIHDCPYGYRVDHGDTTGFLETVRKIRNLSADELETIRRENTEFILENYDAKRTLQHFERRILEKIPALGPLSHQIPIPGGDLDH